MKYTIEVQQTIGEVEIYTTTSIHKAYKIYDNAINSEYLVLSFTDNLGNNWQDRSNENGEAA